MKYNLYKNGELIAQTDILNIISGYYFTAQQVLKREFDKEKLKRDDIEDFKYKRSVRLHDLYQSNKDSKPEEIKGTKVYSQFTALKLNALGLVLGYDYYIIEEV